MKAFAYIFNLHHVNNSFAETLHAGQDSLDTIQSLVRPGGGGGGGRRGRKGREGERGEERKEEEEEEEEGVCIPYDYYFLSRRRYKIKDGKK